mmetsp:Transcript_13144/g.18932  ORF Transcript_13144/g.18932 Transcript_13144/m.18932 type:complete len:94 (-) Transcript_13144:717-998(-)
MSVEKTVESGGIEIDMGNCAELVEPRVGSPQIRFQVRVMSRAPWHYYLDTHTGKTYSKLPDTPAERVGEEAGVWCRIAKEAEPPLVGCHDVDN